MAPNAAEAGFTKQTPKGTPMNKLGRGVANAVTGVFEIPREMHLQTMTGIHQGQYPVTALPEGILKGLFPGVGKALGRIGSGLYDIISFPIEKPANYDALVQPTNVFAAGNWTAPKPRHSP